MTACLAWAIDNNLTRKVSAGDPVQIAMLKGLAAGTVNAGLAFIQGARLPSLPSLLATGVVGFAYMDAPPEIRLVAVAHPDDAITQLENRK